MIKKTKQFVEDVRVEMKKVIWPEREQLVNSTVIVLIISAIFTVFIFFADSIISRVINILY
jgi:preprotein translocase subunit SecE